VANTSTGPLPVQVRQYQFLSPIRFRDQVYLDAASNSMAATGTPFAANVPPPFFIACRLSFGAHLIVVYQ
jgi:hypothetical protein